MVALDAEVRLRPHASVPGSEHPSDHRATTRLAARPAKQHYAEHASDASEADSSAPVGTRSVNAPARHNLLMA